MNATAADVKVRERPILFSAPMVRAILDGRKTQTRRIATHRYGIQFYGGAAERDDPDCWGYFFDGPDHNGYAVLARGKNERHDHGHISIPCPHGDPGDRLWVKETFQIETNEGVDDATAYPPRFSDGRPVRWNDDGDGRVWQQCHYRATDPEHDLVDYDAEDENGDDKKLGWKPSIFMPRWASRIDLKIVAVRVERLQAITENDARAEGVEPADFYGPTADGQHGCWKKSAKYPFEKLWDQINGDRADWKSNPWVWVIEFKRVRP